MLRLLALALIALATPIAATAAEPNASTAAEPNASLESLLAADRDFSAEASKATDPVAALSAMFDDEIVIPFPGKGLLIGRSDATAVFRESPSYKDGKVSWTPIRGGVSADGTHGFTFGFLSLTGGDPARRERKYLSYWIKRPSGWRVVAYRQTVREPGAVSKDLLPPSLPKSAASAASAPPIPGLAASLAAAEKAFSDRAQIVGLKKARRRSTGARNGASSRLAEISASASARSSLTIPKKRALSHSSQFGGATIRQSRGGISLNRTVRRNQSCQPRWKARLPGAKDTKGVSMVIALLLGAAAASVAAPAKPDAGTIKYNSIFPVNVPETVLEPIRGEVGVWDADVELYVGEPAKQPIRKKGVQSNRLVSKGRHMLNEFKYTDGTYEGTGMWGWDAYNNRYTGIWMDGDHNLIRHDIGYYDSASKTMRWEADTLQPDGVTTRMRITEIFDGPTRTFQMDIMDAPKGEYRKLIFMTFRKRPDAP